MRKGKDPEPDREPTNGSGSGRPKNIWILRIPNTVENSIFFSITETQQKNAYVRTAAGWCSAKRRDIAARAGLGGAGNVHESAAAGRKSDAAPEVAGARRPRRDFVVVCSAGRVTRFIGEVGHLL
jgi:hypothetical protein